MIAGKCLHCMSKCVGCIRIESGHARYCDFADPDHPDYNPEFLAVHDAWCEGKPADLAAPGRAQPPREDLSIERAIVHCEFRKKPECGCPEEPHTCTHPDKAGKKWFLDCYRCKMAMPTG